MLMSIHRKNCHSHKADNEFKRRDNEHGTVDRAKESRKCNCLIIIAGLFSFALSSHLDIQPLSALTATAECDVNKVAQLKRAKSTEKFISSCWTSVEVHHAWQLSLLHIDFPPVLNIFLNPFKRFKISKFQLTTICRIRFSISDISTKLFEWRLSAG